MAVGNSKNYITAELDLAERQLAKWEKYMLDNPYDECEDRTGLKRTAKGGSYEDVIQTSEAIQKNLRDTLKEFLALSEVVKRLRQADDAAKEKEAKGKVDVPFRMRAAKDESK